MALNQYYMPEFLGLFRDLGTEKAAHRNYRYKLFPYVPHLLQFDGRHISSFGSYEQVWVHACMLRPGAN